jgi:putative flippase GtrA
VVSIASITTQHQFARFAVVGVLSNLSLYGIYLLLTLATLQPQVAISIIYPGGALLAFLLNRYWTFAHRGDKRSALTRYVVVYAFGYIFNYLMLSTLVDDLGYPHEIVQACVILLLAVGFFLAQKFWVFRIERPTE